MKINSKIDRIENLGFDFTQDDVKNEPMLFNCDKMNAYRLGGLITAYFINSLSDSFFYSPDLVIDSRVHMLLPGFFPCIPGYHTDSIFRPNGGQPDYSLPNDTKHCLLIVGKGSQTEFALGETEVPEIKEGEILYAKWHPIVEKELNEGKLKKQIAEYNKLYYFDAFTLHQGTAATENGWRFFIRASIDKNRKPSNELRRQTQVYLPNPMQGW